MPIPTLNDNYHMKIKLIMVVLLLAVSSSAGAQSSGGASLWSSVTVEKKLSKKLSVDVEAEMRTMPQLDGVSRWSGGVGADYKLLNWLTASAAYGLLYDHNIKYTYHDDGSLNKRADYWAPRHRFTTGLTAEADVQRFTLSVAEKWQYTYTPEKTIASRYDYDKERQDGKQKVYKGKGKSYLRSKFKAEYNVKGLPLTPYASVELYNGWSVKKTRYTLGCGWSITKHHKLGLYYRYQDKADADDNDTERHIIGVDYKFKF